MTFTYVLTKIIIPLAAEVLLIFCAAFFASSETAYTSISRIKVRQMVQDNVRNAKKVSRLKNNLDRLISTVLIGTNFITTLSSAVATAFSLNVLGPEYVSYGTALISVCIIIFSEIIPKTYAAVKSDEVALKSARTIIILQKILFPIVYVFDLLAKFINFLEKTLIKSESPLITEDELKMLLDVGKKEGTLEEDEKKMLDRIFEFSDLQVHGIMRHRSFIKYVNINDSIDEVIKTFACSGYSKLPVCRDSEDSIIGLLNYKSVLFASKELKCSKDFVRICMEDILFVPETMSATDLLKKMKEHNTNFAAAIDEYGETAGIVTMDDILKEVFGRMTDEYGRLEVAPEARISIVSANEFLVPGDMKLDDLNDVLKLNLSSENFDTLGGWLLECFDELPSLGAAYTYNRTVFIVEDQSARRIQNVRIKFLGR